MVEKKPSPYIVLFVLLQHLFRCANNIPCEPKFCCAHIDQQTVNDVIVTLHCVSGRVGSLQLFGSSDGTF